MRTEPHRILMTADAVGGVWTYALDLAHALVDRGTEIVLATMGPAPSEAQSAAAHALPNVELVVSEFSLEWMDDPWEDVAAAGAWLLDLEARVRPDLVHLNGYAHGVLPFTAPVLTVGHSCLLSWADAVPNAIDPEKLSAYEAHVAAGLRAADTVIAPSAAMLDALQRHYGPLKSASVVCNGRRPGLFAPARKEPIVFTAGRLWDRAKNIGALADIAPRLAWPTVAAGAAARTDGSEQASAGRGIRHLGVLDETALADWLARASILALPARYEPFGLLPLEAALSGCALVLGDIPSLREVWDDAADFVCPDDPEALADAVTRLIESPTLRASRASAAMGRAARYTTDPMRDGYLAACARAFENRNHREVLSCAS